MNLEALEKDICYVIKEEFNYLIYFEDGTPDDSYYCFTEEGGHLIYHRFSKNAYKDTFNR